jgi:hypothetical protein
MASRPWIFFGPRDHRSFEDCTHLGFLETVRLGRRVLNCVQPSQMFDLSTRGVAYFPRTWAAHCAGDERAGITAAVDRRSAPARHHVRQTGSCALDADFRPDPRPERASRGQSSAARRDCLISTLRRRWSRGKSRKRVPTREGAGGRDGFGQRSGAAVRKVATHPKNKSGRSDERPLRFINAISLKLTV